MEFVTVGYKKYLRKKYLEMAALSLLTVKFISKSIGSMPLMI